LKQFYPGRLPASYLDGLRPEDRAARYTFDRADRPHTTVAIINAAIVGFATINGSELCALHVDPDGWSGGVGRALMTRARTDLAGGRSRRGAPVTPRRQCVGAAVLRARWVDH
jgi:GNAT superfamily N-acetyltransferase